MMAQSRRRKISSAVQKLYDKTPEQLKDFMSSDSNLIPYLNEYVDEHAPSTEKRFLADTFPTRLQILNDLANTKPDRIQWFRDRWNGRIREESSSDISELAKELRYVWTRPLTHQAETVLDRWLAWRPTPAAFKAYMVSGIERPNADRARDYLPFGCSLGAGRLVPDWVSLRAMLIQGVFEHWKNFKICANSDCVAPYFIAKRQDQTVCDAEICKAERQREHMRKWWNENRAKQQDGSRRGR